MKITLILLLLYSQLFSQTIFRESQIIQAEYFIGNDPGLGKGEQINLNSEISTVAFNLYSINVPKNGFVSVRVKNANGKWSAPRSIKFMGFGIQREALIKNAEYFLNHDPGKNNGTSIPISGEPHIKFSLDSFTISKDDILYVRIRDYDDRWSPT